MKKNNRKPKGLHPDCVKAYHKARYAKARVRFYGRAYEIGWRDFCSFSKDECVRTMCHIEVESVSDFIKRLFGRPEKHINATLEGEIEF